jgi:hypothetical protein
MTDITTRLERLLVGLTHSRRVFASSGAYAAPGADMPEFINEISTFIERVVDEDGSDLFHYYTRGRPVRSLGYPGVNDLAIFPLEAPSDAVELMVKAASECLAWHTTLLMDQDVARKTAAEIVVALGPDATWWANQNDVEVIGLTPLTFDLLVAGTDGVHFAMLLQVADD